MSLTDPHPPTLDLQCFVDDTANTSLLNVDKNIKLTRYNVKIAH